MNFQTLERKEVRIQVIRISLIWLLALVSCTVKNKSSVTSVNNPNIVLFLADDMGYGDLQCYSTESKIPTPNIDRLAIEGLRFTEAHASASVCTPTRYGILTGTYCWRTGLKAGVLSPYAEPLIKKDELTLPRMLQLQGYHTLCLGKWHLGMEWATKGDVALPRFWEPEYDISVIDHERPISAGPLTAGFDYYFGVDVPNFPPYCFIENDHTVGIPSIPKPQYMYGHNGLMIPNWKLEDILPTITNKAIDFIHGWNKEQQDKPFFLYFSCTAPHAPILPSKEFQGKTKAGPYGDFVMQIDDIVGQIEKALEVNGMAENTIFIFTSDNGSPAIAGDASVHGKGYNKLGSLTEMFGHYPNYPLRGLKGDGWDGGHKIPFIVKWPNHIQAGSTSSDLISTIDIFPTLAAITGKKLPEFCAKDSYDFQDVWLGKATNNPLRKTLVHHTGRGGFGIRQGKWKLITHLGSMGKSYPRIVEPKAGEPKGQLFNMEEDTGETNNLWKRYPEIVEKLTALLEKYKVEGRSN